MDMTPLARPTHIRLTGPLALVRRGVAAIGNWVHVRRVLLLVAILLMLGIAALGPIPRALHPPLTERQLAGLNRKERLDAQNARRQRQNEARATLLQAVAASVVLLGAWQAYRQIDVSRRQLTVAQEGQITERFTRAVDQLGNDTLDVRLGGIYALERIASDSDRDRLAILEILTAYIRTHSPWPPSRPGQYVDNAPIDQIPQLQARAPDVQAAVTVLGRHHRQPNDPRLDLHETDLRHAWLDGAHLEGAMLDGAHLERARLDGAHLEEALLLGAHLEGARLAGADLEEAELVGAHLASADLGDANLQGARLTGANMEFGRLAGAHLEGARLYYANLQGARLTSAHLQGARLAGAQLQGAWLDDANLQGAWLVGADLEGAELMGANLQGRRLHWGRLEWAQVDGADLEGAIASAATKWPIGFDWRAAGVRMEPAPGA
jgi:uncharacterized protein YjbI with pentapeptide repeats